MKDDNIKFQVVSDLHIEYKNDSVPDPLMYINPTCPILILAGDIGSLYKFNQLKGFLTKTCELFEMVFYVPGNHEYYTQQEYDPIPMDVLSMKLKSIEKDIHNLYILDRSSIIINDICITGCTLWTEPEVKIPKFIVRIHGMTTYMYQQKHKNDLKYINKMITHCKENKLRLLVVTHHCPSYSILDNLKSPLYSKENNNNRKKDKYVSLYFSHLDSMLKKENINTWICGHIHQNFDFITHGGTRLVGNQYGKPRDNVTDYDKEFSISLEYDDILDCCNNLVDMKNIENNNVLVSV
jgi:hypothetical protein